MYAGTCAHVCVFKRRLEGCLLLFLGFYPPFLKNLSNYSSCPENPSNPQDLSVSTSPALGCKSLCQYFVGYVGFGALACKMNTFLTNSLFSPLGPELSVESGGASLKLRPYTSFLCLWPPCSLLSLCIPAESILSTHRSFWNFPDVSSGLPNLAKKPFPVRWG